MTNHHQSSNISHHPPSSSSDAPYRIRLSDILPHDGAPTTTYLKAVDALSTSLMRHNAAVIQLGPDDAALLSCALESARFFFRNKNGARGVYTFRAGRSEIIFFSLQCWLTAANSVESCNLGVFLYNDTLCVRPSEDLDSSPPCMSDAFRCMGRAARAALSAIARHLRLRSDVFNSLLDDNPLPASEPSSSVLVASFTQIPSQQLNGVSNEAKLASSGESEKGLLMLISSDTSGLQVRDPNGHWYQADSSLAAGELLLLTGKALSHVTAGLRPAIMYRTMAKTYLTSSFGGRTSLAYRLLPRAKAVLDCSPISAAGHVIPQSYVPISVSQFMDDLSAEEDVLCNHTDNAYAIADNSNKGQSLRSVLSDPLSGAFLEDAMLVSCGHSFGGLMLRKVIETSKCAICDSEINAGLLIPNHALRAASMAVKQEDDHRLFHNAALRKRRKEASEFRENGEISENSSHRAVQYPFAVNEKVVIKGNRRTPEKLVGKEAVITSQCLNGWYLLKIIETGENVRLQYRSLRTVAANPTQSQGHNCGS